MVNKASDRENLGLQNDPELSKLNARFIYKFVDIKKN